MFRYKGKKVAVMLSGGADSRITAATAVEAGLEPDFFTFGQSTVNASDFPIASAIAHRLKRPLKTYNANSLNFRDNWRKLARKSNWADMWNLAKLPWAFYEDLTNYDIVLRGDGDGIYGWKGTAGNVSDILHQLEISPMAAALKYANWFKEPHEVFKMGEEARNSIIEEYTGYRGSLLNLKNILYQRHREYGSIAQNLWVLSNWMTCDAPLLWESSMKTAARVPFGKRKHKKLIFAVVSSFEELRDIPFASGSSWNDKLENWMTGLTGELIDYVCEWSPWPVDRNKLNSEWNVPPPVPATHKINFNSISVIKSSLQQTALIRKYVLNYHSEWLHSSFCDRGLTRLALISNLNNRITEVNKTCST